MTERLRDLTDAGDPAVAALAQLVGAATDLDPPPGAQERIRSALAERQHSSRRVLRLVLVSLVLLALLPMAIAGVRKLTAARRFAVSPSVDETKPRIAGRGAAPTPIPPIEIPAPAIDEGAIAPPVLGPSSDPGEAVAAPETAPSPGEPAIAPRQAPVLPDPRAALATEVAPPARRQPGPIPALPPATEVAPARRQPGPIPELPLATSPELAAAARQPGRSLAVPLDAATTRTPVTKPQPGRPSTPAAEAELVLGALRLLRKAHDARGALHQLDEYRARFPDGDLAEEALALSIEASAAAGGGAALALADQYVQRFPHGRFRGLAERVRRQRHVP